MGGHFVFVRREGNGVADAMSRLIVPESLEYQRWLEPPLAVRDVVLREANPHTSLNSAEHMCTQFPVH
ncbi:hypothetical protein V6N12_028819 [Hibiscus sabdariffa]|uniref:RNase H type-1 domain-containing protein n=1 Tax=Hibiscus sabdariffa TaxID=183260 RepID=A0ABR2F703_9ROSI